MAHNESYTLFGLDNVCISSGSRETLSRNEGTQIAKEEAEIAQHSNRLSQGKYRPAAEDLDN